MAKQKETPVVKGKKAAKEDAPKIKASDLKKPKSYAGTQADWEATSPAGKVYHIRKDQGLCVRCGKKAVNKKDGTPGLLCQEHKEYLATFSAKNGEDSPKGTPVKGAKAKAQVKAKTPVKTKVKEKAYKQLGVKQLKDLNAEDEHMAAIEAE